MPARVYLQVLLATFLWGTAFPVGKSALDHAPPLALAGLRFTLAGFLLLAFSAVWQGMRPETEPGDSAQRPANWPRVLLIGTLSTAIFYGLFFLGMNRTSAASAAVVDGVGPIITSVLAHFILHGDRLTSRRLLAIGIAFSGVLVITLLRPAAAHGPSRIDPLGCLLIIAGLTMNGLGTMLVVTYRGRLGLMRLTGCQMCFGGSLLLIASWITEKRLWEPDLLTRPGFLISWLWLATVSAVAFRIWYGLVRRYKITALSVFSFMTAVWGAILSIVFLGNPVTWQLGVGMTLVVAGVLLMNTDRSGRRRELPADAKP